MCSFGASQAGRALNERPYGRDGRCLQGEGADPSTGLEAGPPPLQAGEVFGEHPRDGAAAWGQAALRRGGMSSQGGERVAHTVRAAGEPYALSPFPTLILDP